MTGFLDGKKFQLQKKSYCGSNDRRVFSAMVVTDEEPWLLYTASDTVSLARTADGWLMTRQDGTTERAQKGDYWMKWYRYGFEPEYYVLKKGSPDYYDYNVCSESGGIVGALSIVDPIS